MDAVFASTNAILANNFDEIESPNAPAGDSGPRPDSIGEPAFPEVTTRRLYRRSVAYFFFGYGCKQHSIVTDEPSH